MKLSPRQAVIVALGARSNLSDREIGAYLGVAPSTVDSHRRRAFARLGAHSKAEALFLALWHGMMTAEQIYEMIRDLADRPAA